MNEPAESTVVSVSRSPTHSFSKPVVDSILLIDGYGVEGDAHAGATTEHRYLKKKNRLLPNLTQVHLIHEELFAELADRGFEVGPGQLGENVTTRGIDLLSLPLGTLLHVGDAIVRVTGLRSPCSLINAFQPGLMRQLVAKDDDGGVIRKSGIMSTVARGGVVTPGATIRVELPVGEHRPLGVV
jgi:MOSC domain-containing protein YiiM